MPVLVKGGVVPGSSKIEWKTPGQFLPMNNQNDVAQFNQAMQEETLKEVLIKDYKLMLPNGEVTMGLNALCAALANTTRITVLQINQTYWNDAAAEQFAKALALNKSLKEFKIAVSDSITNPNREMLPVSAFRKILEGFGPRPERDGRPHAQIESITVTPRNKYDGVVIEMLPHLNSTLAGHLSSVHLSSPDQVPEELKNSIKTLYLTGRQNGLRNFEILKWVEAFPKLETLYAAGNDIDIEGFVELLKKPRLRQLHLGDNRIGQGPHTAQQRAKVKEYMMANSDLQQLDLSENRLDDMFAKYMSFSLAANTTLKWLNLSHNHITDLGGVQLGNDLAKNKGLEYFNISYQRPADGQQAAAHTTFGDRGAQHFAYALRPGRNSTLKVLHMEGNRLSSNGCAYFVYCLKGSNDKGNTTIQEVHLEHNRSVAMQNSNVREDDWGLFYVMKLNETRVQGAFSDVGDLTAITDMYNARLQELQNPNLGKITLLQNAGNNTNEEYKLAQALLIVLFCLNALRSTGKPNALDLSGNKIDDRKVWYVEDILVDNANITDINLSGNEIGDQTIDVILQVACFHSHLEKINLKDNKISDRVVTRVRDMPQRNGKTLKLDI